MKKLNQFLSNADCPHISKYHAESFYEHCMFVLLEALKDTDDEVIHIAAALHDIGKPKTHGINKRGENCFYGHENVSAEEVEQFLSKEYPFFDEVVALVKDHMFPFVLEGSGGSGKKITKKKEEMMKNAAHWERLMLLHDFDKKGTVEAEGCDSIKTELICRVSAGYIESCKWFL